MIKIIIFLLLYVPLESIAADDEEVKVSIGTIYIGFSGIGEKEYKGYIRCEWRLDGVY